MKATRTLVLGLLLILGLAGLALGRDTGSSDRNGLTPAAHNGGHSMRRGRHRRHNRHYRRGRRRHKHGGMRM